MAGAVVKYGALRDRITGALSVAECQVLGELAGATTATRALEVGHYHGLSTAVLLSALPERCEFVTVDHHNGDQWSPAVPASEFEQNVAPFIGDRPFQFLNGDMVDVVPSLPTGFGFCFYDADHSAVAVESFWRVAECKLADRCTLVYDDADWDEQATLRSLAEADGFRVVTNRPFHRGEDDKADPATYTLEVMTRG